MRIVGGKLRHRIINMTNLETTRETQDKVRQAIFNMIGPYFDGGVCLDLFAGSGAFGIEALSRGAAFCFFNDLGKIQYKIISNNISNLGIKNAAISSLDYKLALNNLKEIKKKFDIVFVDPPYAMDCYQEIVDFLLNNEMLNQDAILILESNKVLDLEKYSSTFNIKIKKYGYTIVSILKRI